MWTNSALIRHTDVITSKRVVVSEPFSVGQYWIWICVKMIAEDGSHAVALIRLLSHLESPSTIGQEDELYSMACEVSTMKPVRQRVTSFRMLIAYPCGLQRAW